MTISDFPGQSKRAARRFVLVAFPAALVACATYKTPNLPASELATFTIDERAEVKVEGRSLPYAESGSKAREFQMSRGCHELTVEYEESYFVIAKQRSIWEGTLKTVDRLADSEFHAYETAAPIRFVIPVKPGNRYWITATFTGDEFLPRIVELSPSGEALTKFKPNMKCP